MSSDSTKPLIFISYAHLDEPDDPAPGEDPVAQLRHELLAARREGREIHRMDRSAHAGRADWNSDIEAKIRACDIFVLLVSTHSTGSDYILDKEVPIVRERQRDGDGVHVCPLLIDWTPIRGLSEFNDKNLRPRDRNHSQVSAQANAAGKWRRLPTTSQALRRRSKSGRSQRPSRVSLSRRNPRPRFVTRSCDNKLHSRGHRADRARSEGVDGRGRHHQSARNRL